MDWSDIFVIFFMPKLDFFLNSCLISWVDTFLVFGAVISGGKKGVFSGVMRLRIDGMAISVNGHWLFGVKSKWLSLKYFR